MDLEELKKQLYKEKSEFEARPEPPKTFEPGRKPEDLFKDGTWQAEESKKIWRPSLSQKGKKILKFSLIGFLIVILGLAGFLVWRRFNSFDTSKVYLKIFGPERLVSGEEISYIVRYRNDTKIQMQNAKLTFIYPEGSVPLPDQETTQVGDLLASVEDLGNIEPGQENQMEFRIYVAGLKNDTKKAVAKLSYQPANVSSSFENSDEFSSVIFSVPLVLDFDLPERVVNGQQVSIALKYLNTSEITFSDLVLNLEYPHGFNFNSAFPEPSEGSGTWYLEEIAAMEEGKIVISGTLNGDRDEIKTFKANIALAQGDTTKLVSEGLASTIVSVSPLMVQLEVNDARDCIANVGEELRYKIKYENTVDMVITSVFITLKFDTGVLDYSTLRIENGFFNTLDSTITWNESSLSDLKMVQPNDPKTIEFSVRVKNTLPINNFNDKNFLINVSAKIDSSNVPISLRGTQLAGEDYLSTKLNSKLIISAKGYYQDSLMPNSGPLPPKVGQQTTYTIYWRVINLTNDVDNVSVEAYLPSYSHWLGNFEPKDADIKYDPTTGKLSWSLGKLAANTGILSPVKQLVFQIGFIPGSNQVGQTVQLIKETLISGKDLFTQAMIENKDSSIYTDLPDDPTVDYYKGKVSQ